MNRRALSIDWIRPLAAPYLRGYRPVARRSGSLRGYWFLTPQKANRQRLGFFVGFLLDGRELAWLNADPPECLIFVCVDSPGGALHERLVSRPESLLRRAFDYIRWLTHRPPRFVLQPDQGEAMLRHQPMREWPPGKLTHYSRNFFIETLAWLVRSGVVKRLYIEPVSAAGEPDKATRAAQGPGCIAVNDKRRGPPSRVSRKGRSR